MAALDEPDLLAAAMRAFEQHGYADTTMERIAVQAGVSRITLHRRGVTKNDLLAQLVARATDEYQRAMWPALTAPGTGAQRLRQALEALCDNAEAHMPLLVALRAQSDGIFHREPEHGQPTLTRTVFTDPLEKLLRDGNADGSLRAVDPLETATVLFNLVGWTYIHLRTGHGWTADHARGSLLDLALQGLLRS